MEIKEEKLGGGFFCPSSSWIESMEILMTMNEWETVVISRKLFSLFVNANIK